MLKKKKLNPSWSRGTGSITQRLLVFPWIKTFPRTSDVCPRCLPGVSPPSQLDPSVGSSQQRLPPKSSSMRSPQSPLPHPAPQPLLSGKHSIESVSVIFLGVGGQHHPSQRTPYNPSNCCRSSLVPKRHHLFRIVRCEHRFSHPFPPPYHPWQLQCQLITSTLCKHCYSIFFSSVRSCN